MENIANISIYSLFQLCFIAFSTSSVNAVPNENQPSCRHKITSRFPEIWCTKDDGIGEYVDKQFTGMNNASQKLLQLDGIKFRNPSLNRTWYNGTETINAISFQACNIRAFHSGAFEGAAFREMRLIRIVDNTDFVYLESNAFGRTCNLHQILIENTTISNIGPGFEWGDCKKLVSLRCELCLKSNVSVEAFLSAIKPRIVKTFSLHISTNESPKFTTLAANNFRNSVDITILSLPNCGIEFVMENTFNTIGQNLTNLSLARNKIKHLRLSQFETFLWTNNLQKTTVKLLHIAGNPIECDCDYFLLENVMLINVGFYTSRNMIDQPCPLPDDNMASLQCNNIQFIHVDKVCLPVANQSYTGYVRLKMKFQIEKDTLIVKRLSGVDDKSRLRVILIHFKLSRHRRCSSEVWSRRLAQCLMISNGIQSIRNDFYRRSNFTIVSIMYLTSQRVWPLHLMTIRNPYTREDQSEADSRTIAMWATCALSAGGFVSAFVVFVWYKQRNQHSRSQDINLSTSHSTEPHDHEAPTDQKMVDDGNEINYEYIDIVIHPIDLVNHNNN